MPALIAARALQGIGGGGILPLAHTIIGDMVSPRERPRYQSYTAIMFMAASIVGPGARRRADRLRALDHDLLDQPAARPARAVDDRPRAARGCRATTGRTSSTCSGAALMVCAALALMLAMNWGGTRYRLDLAADPRPARRARRAVARCSRCGSRARRSRSFRLSILREPIVAAMAVAGFFSDRRGDRAVDLPAALFRAGAGLLAERLGHRADRVPGRRDRRLVHRRPADGAADALQARADRRHACSAS